MTDQEIALMLIAEGLSVIPVKADKTPMISWAKHQRVLPTEAETANYFGNGHGRFALVCGEVSGGLETLDFDVIWVGDSWLEMLTKIAPDLLKRLYITETPSGGYHIRYRCTETIIPGNSRLAVDSEGNVLIETRGEGGYALCPPSDNYNRLQGRIEKIPTISAAERDLLIELCRSFDTKPTFEIDPSELPSTPIGQERPGDKYNAAPDVEQKLEDVLLGQGWIKVADKGGRVFWLRPGSANKWSANYSRRHNLFYVFSSDCGLESDQAYRPFAVMAFLEFGGDFSAAARSLIGGVPVPTVSDDQIETEAVTSRETPLEMVDLLPENSWLGDYLDYVYPTVDSPNQFTLACGLSVVSMCLRDAYVPFGAFRIKPNLWMAIVAPSSIYRKSTSIRIARNLLADYEPGIVLPDQMSPEAFIGILSRENSFGLLHWSEMASQLLAFEKSYMADYKSILTELYDCPATFTRMTQKDGAIEIKEPFINILCASTQKWLNDCLSEGNMKGGFLPRFIYVQADKKDRFVGFPDSPDEKLKAKLLTKMDEMTRLYQGPIQVGEAARQIYCQQAEKMEQASIGSDLEGLIGAFYSRLSVYVLKFSLIYQAMMGEQKVIGAEAMEYAVRLGEYLRTNIDLVMERITFSYDMADRQKVMGIIETDPGITRSNLLRRSHMNIKRLDEALDTLIEADIVTKKKNRNGKGRPSVAYFKVKN